MKFAVRHHSCYIMKSDIRENSRLADGALFIVDIPDNIDIIVCGKNGYLKAICSKAFEMQNDNGSPKVVEDYPSMSYGDVIMIATSFGKNIHMFCDRAGWKEVTHDFYKSWLEMNDSLDRQRFGSEWKLEQFDV